ncbi:hypothetical protein [Burkholderia sp. Ac-20353]|uniref:hypothetical protein n=1 Tax=Burkholderia sp. Ac-20353 TaxID=2703894 RepID=UPI00197BFC44|nr:hypothetical protein [Burkholderia sp. Ac-20353]MBN3785637.1 hypothetical protein [Burkholderia sp. Ac-20353]
MARHSFAALMPPAPTTIATAKAINAGLAIRPYRVMRAARDRSLADREGAGNADIAFTCPVMSITMGCDAYCACRASISRMSMVSPQLSGRA